jgi:tetratricopeptide (TPR) repeat protein
MKHLGLFFSLIMLSMNIWAQDGRFKVFKEDSEDRATVSSTSPLSIYFEERGWNNDPTSIEKGFLFLRDKNTGEIMELTLTETKPNSSVFTIDFPVGTLKQKKIAVEIYSVPESLLDKKNRLFQVQQYINDGSIKRKPFLLRVLKDRSQIMDVFDNKEVALDAYNEYRKKMGLSPESTESESIVQVAIEEKPRKKQVIDTSTLQSLFLANEQDLSTSARKNKEIREVLESVEKKRRQALQEQANQWTPQQTRENKRRATQMVKDAVKEIGLKNFQKSQELFAQASDLDPKSDNLYEQYGVSLFRNKLYNQSIVILNLSEPSRNRLAEKNFYLGMNFYQLKDYTAAIENFDQVFTAPENKSFAGSAAFYKGSAYLELREYDKAKESFQYVLDNSSDPQMDKQAEKFIEYTINQQALAKKRSNWFFIDGVIGLIYDSNIILASDQVREQGLVTNEDGMRLLTQVSTQFRPYYSDTDEIRIGFDLTALRSFDTSFGPNPTAERADPYLVGINVPWTHRGTIDNKGYFFDLVPGFEAIIMDLDGSGNDVITQSAKLDFRNTLLASKNWIAKADLFLSYNESNIANFPSGPDAADSVTAGFRLSSVIIINKELERYLIPDLSYRINDAKDAFFAFNRFDIGLTYTSAVFGKWMWNTRLGYFLANYQTSRVDNNYSFSTGLSRRISPNWNWGIMGSYIVNNSTFNPFDKYNVVSTFTFSY